MNTLQKLIQANGILGLELSDPDPLILCIVACQMEQIRLQVSIQAQFNAPAVIVNKGLFNPPHKGLLACARLLDPNGFIYDAFDGILQVGIVFSAFAVDVADFAEFFDRKTVELKVIIIRLDLRNQVQDNFLLLGSQRKSAFLDQIVVFTNDIRAIRCCNGILLYPGTGCGTRTQL